jgi:uncharacterized protein
MTINTGDQRIDQFFESKSYGVVGASINREKYGNKVLRVYQQKDMEVFPIHPKEESIEGINTYKSVTELPESVKSISSSNTGRSCLHGSLAAPLADEKPISAK